MVERLKAAIEKARERRQTEDAPRGGAAARVAPPASAPARDALAERWAALPELDLDPQCLARQRVVAYDRQGVGATAFDVLRTRLLRACSDNGWSRIGVTSPTKGCGKTTICVNLAFSLSRLPNTTAVLIDTDLKVPSVARYLGVRTERRIDQFLSGRISHMEYLERANDALAFGLNGGRVAASAELLQTSEASAALARMKDELRPTIILHDLPPMLLTDDVLGFMRSLDAVLLVAAAGATLAAEIESCENLIGDNAAFLGVVLNKVEDQGPEGYYVYGYGEGYGYGGS